jgi:hypothetical protein
MGNSAWHVAIQSGSFGVLELLAAHPEIEGLNSVNHVRSILYFQCDLIFTLDTVARLMFVLCCFDGQN